MASRNTNGHDSSFKASSLFSWMYIIQAHEEWEVRDIYYIDEHDIDDEGMMT